MDAEPLSPEPEEPTGSPPPEVETLRGSPTPPRSPPPVASAGQKPSSPFSRPPIRLPDLTPAGAVEPVAQVPRACDDFALPIPPASCFGRMRDLCVPQENFDEDVTVGCLLARLAWIEWESLQLKRAALYTAGPKFLEQYIHDTNPLVAKLPSHFLSIAPVESIPYPMPVPALTSNKEWRALAHSSANLMLLMLRVLGPAATHSEDGELGQHRKIKVPRGDHYDARELFQFFPHDDSKVEYIGRVRFLLIIPRCVVLADLWFTPTRFPCSFLSTMTITTSSGTMLVSTQKGVPQRRAHLPRARVCHRRAGP